MRIELNNISKKFNQVYVFRKLSFIMESGSMYYVKGSNGSGKSTLLQLIAGILSPSSGGIQYFSEEKQIDRTDVAMRLCIAAPYLELVEEMNLTELVELHFKLREPLVADFREQIRDTLGYSEHKQIRTYSSGMKQKLKLMLAILTKSDLVLLDEPTANFDQKNIDWYREFLAGFRKGRTTIIGSPQAADWEACRSGIDIEEFK